MQHTSKSPKQKLNSKNLNQVNLNSGLDYKELQKTLIQFQKTQQQLERTGKLSPLKSLPKTKHGEMINFQSLEEAGLINQQEELSNIQVPGVQVKLEDIKKAFEILDNKNGGNKISLNELKKKIPKINPNFPVNEIPALTQGKNELKATDLYELLKKNELKDFDPLEEAYNLLNPKANKDGNKGIDVCRLKEIFKVLGYQDLDKKEEEILKQCLDVDNDGEISLDDIRKIFEQEILK